MGPKMRNKFKEFEDFENEAFLEEQMDEEAVEYGMTEEEIYG
ncbi:Uncharacterised protein [uncultured archaeon]|nr:Uncharacterised protein [uncultured archaeon]